MFATSYLSALSLIAFAIAAPVDEAWLQARDGEVATLFKRGTTDPSDPSFSSQYPGAGSTPSRDSLPQAWLDKLASIQLPDIQPSSPNNGYPTYTGGESGADEHICSFTYQCTTDEDLLNPPSGVFALNFDDGPGAASPDLYAFLAENNIADAATHFMIGGNILSDPFTMQAAAKAGGHIAVHTWSHPYMTTLSNEDVLGELGWTMQIISDLNGGRIPKYWRPPYGDVDNRVRAIAKGVFGLETVPWNTDSADWAIGSDPQYTPESVEAMLTGWLQGDKKNGLLLLEHEIKDTEVNLFKTIFPKIGANGWKIQSVADAFGMDWYVNSGKGNNAAVTTMSVAANTLAVNSATTSESSTSASASGSSSASAASGDASSSTSAFLTSASAAGSSATSAAASSASAAAAGSNNTSSGSSVVSLPVTGFVLGAVGLLAAFL
ncbi:hypothetical protein IAU59_003574 [Kwoniella sp. CBS 9459]